MDAVFVEGVRCFHSRQSARIRPITILIGENSSGKSTFLASLRIASRLLEGDPSIDFNQAPFSLGAFDQVASYIGGRGGRAKEFRFGATFSNERAAHDSRSTVQAVGVFGAHHAQPYLKDWTLEAAGVSVSSTFQPDGRMTAASFQSKTGTLQLTTKDIEFIGGHGHFGAAFPLLDYFLRRARIADTGGGAVALPQQSEFEHLLRYLRSVRAAHRDTPFAFAPIRSQPQRTYDPLRDLPNPEGSHVPMFLARTASLDHENWRALRDNLDAFGKASGLFRSVEVKQMGDKESDPFQIRVRVSKAPFNLVDVGYGVSQVLPIIVDVLEGAPGSTFLLQQPEVHLHPQAQAELGTFLASLAAMEKKRFVIETHSDYLVDRIRLDVRDKKSVRAEDVLLLYFARKGNEVTISEIEIDDLGNLRRVPTGYRQFFLREERRLFLET